MFNISEKRPEVGAVVLVKVNGAFAKALYSEEAVDGGEELKPVFTRVIKNHKDGKLDETQILSNVSEWDNIK